jgi:hypothetical protein
MAVHWTAGGLLLLWLKPGLANGSSFIGVLMAAGGAALSYWETNLESHEVIAITNVILNAGQSNKIAPGDQRLIVGLTLVSILYTGILVIPAVMYSVHDGYQLAVKLVVAIVFAAIWPAIYCVFMMWRTSWSYQQANLWRPQSFGEREATITGWIHRCAFWALYVAGLCQIPLLLSHGS